MWRPDERSDASTFRLMTCCCERCTRELARREVEIQQSEGPCSYWAAEDGIAAAVSRLRIELTPEAYSGLLSALGAE
jgi:hypothetical protein